MSVDLQTVGSPQSEETLGSSHAVEVWRTDATRRGFVGAVIAASVVAVPAAVVAGARHLSNTGLGWWLLVAATCAGLVPLFHRLAFHPLVQADEHGLLIRNVTDEHRVSWAEITKLTPGYFGLRIDLSDGRSIDASALSKSNYAVARGKLTRADAIAAVLAERAAHEGRAAVALPDAGARRRSTRTARLVLLAGCVLIAGRIALVALQWT